MVSLGVEMINKAVHMLYQIVIFFFVVAIWGYFVIIRNSSFSFKAGLFLILVMAGLIIIMKTIRRNDLNDILLNSKYSLWIALGLVLLCFVSRLIYIKFMIPYVIQKSDFKIILDEARTGVFKDQLWYYQMFPHKFFYPLLLNYLGLKTQESIFVLQSLLSAITCFLIYKTGEQILSATTGLIAEILYILWPAQIVYNSIITEEHIAATIQIGIICLIVYLLKIFHRLDTTEKKTIKHMMIISIFIGTLMGLSRLFKDWGIIALTAVLLCTIPIMFEAKRPRYNLLLLGIIVLMIVTRSIVVDIALNGEEEKLSVKVNRSNTVYYYVALDPESTGGYNKTLYDEYVELVKKHEYNYNEANKEAITILANKIKNNPGKLLLLLWNKGCRSQSSDFEIFEWSLISSTNDEFKEAYYYKVEQLIDIDCVYYVFMVLTIIVGVFISHKEEKLFFLIMYVFGSALVSFLVESQGRYKFSIEPTWCVCVSYVLIVFTNYISECLALLNVKKSHEN